MKIPGKITVKIARGDTKGFENFLKKRGKLEDGELFLNRETKELYIGTPEGILTFTGVPMLETETFTLYNKPQHKS